MAIADKILRATSTLSREVNALRFEEPVSHVYNPLVYASKPHRAYIRDFANSKKKVVFLGMNPGPFGMAQTGVPFGEIAHVRDWMKISGTVTHPEIEHPKKPVQGFECTRSEVSGRRLWGAIAEHWGTPKRFFRHHFVANYCPLLFLEASGRNRTPDKLSAKERDALYRLCDEFLRLMIRNLEPEWVVGIGTFAEKRAREALPDFDGKIGRILHPSPASPKANRDWVGSVRSELHSMGLCP